MRRSIFFFSAIAFSSCFNVEINGGQLACPDDLCPDDFVCELGICFDGDANCDNIGFCALTEGGPCLTNIGCTPTPECPVVAGTAEECTLGTVCVDNATLEDVPAFQRGDIPGTCVAQVELDAGDDCEPGDVVNVCPIGTGCNNGTCQDLIGEPGDTCANAIEIEEGTTSFHNAGFANDTTVAQDFLNGNDVCGVDTASGADVFFTYTVQGSVVDVRISTSGTNTLADTVVYFGTACDANGVGLLTQLACDDDQTAEDDFNDFTSEFVVPSQTAGTVLIIVVDSFILGREGFIDLTITEE